MNFLSKSILLLLTIFVLTSNENYAQQAKSNTFTPGISGNIGLGVAAPASGEYFTKYFIGRHGVVSGFDFELFRYLSVGFNFRTHRFNMKVDQYMCENYSDTACAAVFPFTGGDVNMKQFGINLGTQVALFKGKVLPYLNVGLSHIGLIRESIQYSIVNAKFEHLVPEVKESTVSFDCRVGLKLKVEDNVCLFTEYALSNASMKTISDEAFAFHQFSVGLNLKL